ncbi:hypothetical protein [Haloferula sp.]|uniref:hypothetical protein n=1 Tax=Haloferula sp. TaxID=2497595 RepID=UPI003C75A4A1
MNVRNWIPPLVALAIAGVWLGSQRSQIRDLRSETEVIRERMKTVRAGMNFGGDSSLAMRMKEQKESADGEIDWKDLGAKMAEGQHGRMADMRAMMELQTSLMELSGDELLAELAKIDALDLSKEVREALDGLLVGMLVNKDPKAVLDRYLDRINDPQGGMTWQLSNAFKQWQEKDPEVAMAWFDAEIVKGTFDSKALDGRSASRLRFEATTVGSLLSSDPAAALKRVEGLPEDQRKQLFQQGAFSSLKEEDHQAFAQLVRSAVAEDERGEAYRQTVSSLMRVGEFEKVDGFISDIGASDAEKEAIVSEAARHRIQTLGGEGKVDREAVDEMRAWAMVQSPDQVDAITGKSLANVWGEKSTFEGRVKIVEELHAEGAGDDLIVSFLTNSQLRGESVELSRSLAERVGDEAKRAELIKKFEQ